MKLIPLLPSPLSTLLERITLLATNQGTALWLVGGVIRDLLLGVPLGRDLDLVVEGDVAALSAALVAELGANLRAAHPEFGTASVAFVCDGAEVVFDLARARREVYPQPAVLPVVEPATLEEDLGRRDFSVNAMALELRIVAGNLCAGEWHDPFAGQADLSQRCLRLLHQQSLRDDPTRLLRGVRLAARLNLHPDSATLLQIRHAISQGYLGLLTPERILGELCLALEEPQPLRMLAHADAWELTPQIVPGLHATPHLATRLARYAAHPPRNVALSQVVAGLLIYDLAADDLHALSQRYPLPSPFARLFSEIPRLRDLGPQLQTDLRPSQIDLFLRPYSDVAIHVLHYAETGIAAQRAIHYLEQMRPLRLPLDGRDIQRLGVAPGPAIGKILAGLRTAYLDGVIQTREQAEAWVINNR